MATLDGLIVPRLPGFKGEIPVLNLSTSVTIAANAVLQMDTTTANTLAGQYSATPGAVGLAVAVCTAGSYPVGVAVASIPPGGQGTMQIDGFIQVANSAAGSVAVGGIVIPDAGGQVKASAGAGVPALGVSWSIGTAQADLLYVQLTIGASDSNT